MRAVVQRVHEASVTVEQAIVGSIAAGLLVFIGIEPADDERDAAALVDKIVGLRCFGDEDGKFNLSLADIKGEVLAISQFTLFGDCRKGRRPSFTGAARPDHAVPLYELAISMFRAAGITVAAGIFGAHMEVASVNDGPVTLLLDTKKVF